jgi:hypothetical protein
MSLSMRHLPLFIRKSAVSSLIMVMPSFSPSIYSAIPLMPVNGRIWYWNNKKTKTLSQENWQETQITHLARESSQRENLEGGLTVFLWSPTLSFWTNLI